MSPVGRGGSGRGLLSRRPLLFALVAAVGVLSVLSVLEFGAGVIFKDLMDEWTAQTPAVRESSGGKGSSAAVPFPISADGEFGALFTATSKMPLAGLVL